MQLLFSDPKVKVTLVNYTRKSFITLTPGTKRGKTCSRPPSAKSGQRGKISQGREKGESGVHPCAMHFIVVLHFTFLKATRGH